MGIETIAVLGAGQLGYANAVYLAPGVANVLLYDRTAAVVDRLNSERRHPRHFPDTALPSNVRATHHLEDLADADMIFIDLHSTGIRPVFEALSQYLKDGVVIVNDAKGLETGSHKLPLEVVAEELHRAGKTATLAARSGWMLAENLVNGRRSYADIACPDYDVSNMVAELTSGRNLKVHLSTDMAGVQLAGVMKNVYAICAGLLDGMIKANPSKRALYEEAKRVYMRAATEEAGLIGESLGARRKTFSTRSYSWWKDYSNSCTHNTINRLLGEQIGLGMGAEEAYEFVHRIRHRKPEGYNATRELYLLALETGINAPILHHTYQALFTDTSVEDALMRGINELSQRPMFSRTRERARRVGRVIAKGLRAISRRRAKQTFSKSP